MFDKLADILKDEGLTKTAGKIREFVRSDWYGWAGAEAWPDHEPWLAELENVKIPDLADYLDFGEYGDNEAWDVQLVGDAEGVGIHFYGSRSGDQGPTFHLRGSGWEPEEAYGALKAALRKVQSGKIPSRYTHEN